jgi:hypothetical protein
MVGSPDAILARLQEAGRRDLGDYLTLEVGPDEDHTEIQNDGMKYDGLRFRAECKLAARVYGPRAHQPGIWTAVEEPMFQHHTEPSLTTAQFSMPVARATAGPGKATATGVILPRVWPSMTPPQHQTPPRNASRQL